MRRPQVTGARHGLGALTFAVLVAGAGCGAIDAEDEPFAGTIVYQDPGGAFALRLLEPPWLPPLSTQGTTLFVVPPSDATVTADLSVVLDEALYSLALGPESGSPATLAQALGTPLPAAAMADETPAMTASGATGVQLTWQEDAAGGTRFHRDVFLSGPSTLTYHLAFMAKRQIADDAMVGQMITSFVPYL
jgi:hypothetical protein